MVDKTALMMLGAGGAFMTIAAIMVLPGYVILSPTPPALVMMYSSKLEFTARYLVLELVWCLGLLSFIATKRLFTAAFDPTSNNEKFVEVLNRILNNSMEQLVLSALGQFSLIAFLTPEFVIRVIPLVNYLYLIGRIAFLIGYPLKRHFGFSMSLVPTTLMIFYAFAKFVSTQMF